MLVVDDMRGTGSAPFCEGFVQRVRNWDAGGEQLAVQKSSKTTNLIAVANELLRNVDEFAEFVRHGCGGWSCN